MVQTIRSDFLPTLRTEEFLPPISRWTSLGGLFLIATVGVVVLLASVTRYNVAVKASATVRPSGELRLVQSGLEGTVKQIEVKENQTVRQGDVIAYLDDAKLQIQRSQLQASIQQNQFQLTQLDAQVRQVDTQILAESRSIDGAIAAAEAETRRNQQEHQEKQLTSAAEFQEVSVTLEQAQDEMNRYHQLAEVGAISELQMREKQTAVRSAQARLERARAALNPSDANVAIAQKQVTQQVARRESTLASLTKEREALLQRRSEIQSQMIRDQKDLEQVNRDLSHSVIQATSDGVIFKLNLLNSNQVVRPGDTVAQIAPNTAPLVVKAKVENQDIDQVAIGQIAHLRIDACPYPDYGILKGTVTATAADAGQGTDAATGNTQQSGSGDRSFEVTIQPNQSLLVNGNRRCQIQAGMEASAKIISDQETFLQFVLRKARLFIDL